MVREDYTFDILVVGGGSAGCALAGRLARDSRLSVGLVEAGPDYGPLAGGRWPRELLDPRKKPKTHDWGYGQSRARVIGGCSAHNQCAAIWPLPSDFDAWASGGSPAWSYAQVRPLIDAIERDLSPMDEPFRGHAGLVPTEPYGDDQLSIWHRAFLDASLDSGYPRLHDLSAPEPAEGVTPFHANVNDSVRWNASLAFLDPVRSRPNLTIFGETLAARLVVERGRASELIARRRGEEIRIRAVVFVLASGTFGSPSILLRSGIGAVSRLEPLGIAPQIDLPGVGENLQDHPGVTLRFRPNRETMKRLEEEVEAGRFYQSQVNMRARSAHCEGAYDLHVDSHQSRTRDGDWDLELMAFNMAPRSFGRVSLTNLDPEAPPRIDFRFLTDADGHDLAVLADSVPLMRELAALPPLKRLIKGEAEPGHGVASRDAMADYIRRTVDGYGHSAGTCRMGRAPDSMSVVDERGRLRGAENILVADASILPRLPRANTNLLCFLIGWRIGGWLLGS